MGNNRMMAHKPSSPISVGLIPVAIFIAILVVVTLFPEGHL